MLLFIFDALFFHFSKKCCKRISNYKNAYSSVRKLFRIVKIDVWASGGRFAVSHYDFALRKCRPERPGAFRVTKMQAAARISRKSLFYQRKTMKNHIWRPLATTPPPWRQHKNVTFRKSAVKFKEKSYVRTRPEKSSGGEGLRPPPKVALNTGL